jgi:FKBP-type peptidyl-prolyl cis-trans isomerase (trigger factor)
MTQSNNLQLQPVNAKLREKIRDKLTKISDKQAAELYRENCNGLLDGVAVEGPIQVPPGLDENQTVNFLTQVRARFQQQETQLVDLMQKLWTRLSMLED